MSWRPVSRGKRSAAMISSPNYGLSFQMYMTETLGVALHLNRDRKEPVLTQLWCTRGSYGTIAAIDDISTNQLYHANLLSDLTSISGKMWTQHR